MAQTEGDGPPGNKSKLVLNVGSRNSQLALIQTRTVIDKLENHYGKNPAQLAEVDFNMRNGIDFEVISMTTAGDRILDKALPEIGSKSLFTKDLEVALLERRVDFIVHSLKDLPTTLPEGCVIGAVLQRDDPDDAIVLRQSLNTILDPIDALFDNRKELNVGTSSNRRISMLKRCNSKIRCTNIRGNLNTRLAKLDKDDGLFDAIVLARAGLDRMGWTERMSAMLKPERDPRLASWCYAVGQGAIAVECRQEDQKVIDLLAPLCDLKTTYEVIAERCLMKKLEGGCSVPLGVRCQWFGDYLTLKSIVLSTDGQSIVEAKETKNLNRCNQLAQSMTVETSGSRTTGIVLTDKFEGWNNIRDRLIACSDLGIVLADKMIELGCLELMKFKAMSGS